MCGIRLIWKVGWRKETVVAALCSSRGKGWICDEHWKIGQSVTHLESSVWSPCPWLAWRRVKKHKYMSFISYVGWSSSHALCRCYAEVAAGFLCPKLWEESKSLELRKWFKWKARTIHIHGDMRAEGPFSNQPITLWNMEYGVASV